jgi:phenylacetate-coenzyme A ligase PaaK-like adenylate-forming protein
MIGHTCLKRHTTAPNHIHPYATFIVELLDVETGESLPLEDGSQGEVVITSLTPIAFPLIRYRTGDYAVVHSSGICECGSTLPLIEVLGRVELDRVKLLPYGGLSTAALEQAIEKLPFRVADFACVWKEHESPPTLSVVLYTDATPPADVVPVLSKEIHISSTKTYEDLVAVGAVGAISVQVERVVSMGTASASKRKRLSVER